MATFGISSVTKTPRQASLFPSGNFLPFFLVTYTVPLAAYVFIAYYSFFGSRVRPKSGIDVVQ